MVRGLDGYVYLHYPYLACAVFKLHRASRKIPVVHSERETPLPIPNRAVKPFSADGTWGATPWESRSPPVLRCTQPAPSWSRAARVYGLRLEPRSRGLCSGATRRPAPAAPVLPITTLATAPIRLRAAGGGGIWGKGRGLEAGDTGRALKGLVRALVATEEAGASDRCSTGAPRGGDPGRGRTACTRSFHASGRQPPRSALRRVERDPFRGPLLAGPRSCSGPTLGRRDDRHLAAAAPSKDWGPGDGYASRSSTEFSQRARARTRRAWRSRSSGRRRRSDAPLAFACNRTCVPKISRRSDDCALLQRGLQ